MTTRRTVINWLLVYLLIFMSGSWRYNLSTDKYLVLGFLVAFTAWYLFTDRKISDRFLLYALVFFGFLFALSLYTGGGITLPSIIGGLMKLLIAYFVLKAVGEASLEIFIRLIVFLAVASLVGFASDQFHLFDGLVRKLPAVGAMGYEGLLYVFRSPRHIDRNNSIFFEPGAYQGFLNAALFLLVFTKTNIENRTRWIFIAILAVTLATTLSTTGFVIFAAMLPVFLYKSRVVTFSGKIKIVAALFAVTMVFSAQFYSSVVEKLARYTTAEVNTEGRSSDYKADLKIFKEHIFGIGYDQYGREFGTARGDMSVQAGSNGVTSTLAKNGLPFSLFLFGSYYWALKRLLGDFLLASLAFGMVMMFLWAEAYYVGAPVIYAIIAGAFVFGRRPVQRETGETGETGEPAR